MELDAIENTPTREAFEAAVDKLAGYGICREWATDLVMMVYLRGLREKNED
jgi:hypothetical protein